MTPFQGNSEMRQAIEMAFSGCAKRDHQYPLNSYSYRFFINDSKFEIDISGKISQPSATGDDLANRVGEVIESFRTGNCPDFEKRCAVLLLTIL